MKRLEETSKISLPGLEIWTEHKGDNDWVYGLGSDAWELSFGDPYGGGYGMFHEASLYQIDESTFIFIQVYEHSRGGHVDPVLHCIDVNGNIGWSKMITGVYLNCMHSNGIDLFIINSWAEDRPKGNPDFTGKHVERIDLNSGETVESVAIFHPDGRGPNPDVRAYISKFGITPFLVEIFVEGGEAWVKVWMSQFGESIQKDFEPWKRRLSELVSI